MRKMATLLPGMLAHSRSPPSGVIAMPYGSVPTSMVSSTLALFALFCKNILPISNAKSCYDIFSVTITRGKRLNGNRGL